MSSAFSPARRTRTAVLLGLAIVALGAAFGLLRVQQDAGYSNQVGLDGPAARIPAGAEACQPDEAVPANADDASMVVGRGRVRAGQLQLAVRAAGRTVVRSAPSARPRRSGYVLFELPGRNPELAEASVCVRNRGPGIVSILGVPGGPGPNATPALPGYGPPAVIDGRPQPGRFRVDYAGRGDERFVAQLPRIVERAGLVKGTVIGTFAIWLALLGVLVAGVLAVRAVLWDGQP